MDIIYRSLVKRLTDTVLADLSEDDKTLWIDLEAGQLDYQEQNYPVTFPALFIDLSECEYRTLGNGLQEGILTISLRIAFDIYNDFHAASNDYVNAANHLTLINSIHAALHGFGGNVLQDEDENYIDIHFSRLQRTGLTSEKRTDGLKVFTMTYQTTVHDIHAMPSYTPHQVDDVVISTPIPQPEDGIPVVSLNPAYSESATFVTLQDDLIPLTDVPVGTVILFTNITEEDYTTYPGNHTVVESISPRDFIIDVPYDNKEPADAFVVELVSVPE